MPYSYAAIADHEAKRGVSYRVADPDDNRIATCYEEDNAKMIVAKLNAASELLAVAQLLTLAPLQHGTDVPDELMAAARAAIAKAEGR